MSQPRPGDMDVHVEDAKHATGRTVDGLLEDVVKPFGCWQFVVLMLGICTDIPAAIFPIYANSVPSKFRCQVEPHIQQLLLANQTDFVNLNSGVLDPKGPPELVGNQYAFPFDDIAAATGPWGNQTKAPGCFRYKRDYDRVKRLEEFFSVPKSVSVEACPHGYVYEADKFQYPSGIVIEWDLVCDREWLAPLSTSLYMLGMVPGFWIGGILADSIGRRPTALAFWTLQVVVGVLCSFAPNFTSYAVFRFLLGLTSVARANVLLILPGELTVAKYRFIVSSSMCIVQSFINRALVTLVAYFLPYWRWVHLAITSPLAIGILQIWLLPESPRWLLAKGRHEEAMDTLYKGYLINRRGWFCWKQPKPRNLTLTEFRNHFFLDSEGVDKDDKEKRRNPCVRFLDGLRRPYQTAYLTRVSLIATFLFTAQAACLFGVLLYARIIRSYVYLVAFINNLTGIPGAFLSAILYAKIRHRKLPLMIVYLCASFCLAAGGIYALLTPHSNDIGLTISSNLGLILCTAITNMILTYIPELYPSCIRSQGLGNAAGLGRFGATLGTFINELDVQLSHGTPLIIYAGLLLLALVALIFLPDTTGENLVDRFEERKAPEDDRLEKT
ncbi:unnamed protein product [Mesocestoides corti]|uniref:MFS domain-containing protein n=1 Tax=Mesocestoides corti TaxID=53468 RepID=A0A0R3U5L6_MESCO|nr:unnamed protein product [Mesocestoides corti]